MLVDILNKIALRRAAMEGWKIPSDSEMKSAKTIKDFAELLIKYNPDKEKFIQEKFNDLQKIL